MTKYFVYILFSQVKKLGMFATARSIVRVEGIGGLYRGIKPAIARHIPYTGTRVMLYDFLRTKIVGDQPLGKDGKKPGLFAYLFHTKMTCFYTYSDVIILTLRIRFSAHVCTTSSRGVLKRSHSADGRGSDGCLQDPDAGGRSRRRCREEGAVHRPHRRPHENHKSGGRTLFLFYI